MRFIDAKAHGISSDPAAYPPASQKSWEGRPPATWERLIEMMDEAGIEKTVLVQSTSTYGYDNSYVAGGPKAYPDRFAWVGSVDVLAPDGASQVQSLVKDQGMSGLRISTTANPENTAWIADPATYPVWETARGLGIPVGVLNIGESGLMVLDGLLRRFPGVRLIIDHLLSAPLSKGPSDEIVEAFFALAKYPTVHVELTGPEFTEENKAALGRFLPQAIVAFGTERLFWGSNYPTSPGPTGKLLDAAKAGLSFLPEADLERIFFQNVQVLYPALRTPS